MLNPSFTGIVANNSGSATFKATDDKKKIKYLFAGNLKRQNSDYRLSFIQDSMILNFKKWTVAPDNYLVFGKNMIYANDVLLSSGNESLKINSTGLLSAGAPLEITLTD